MRKKILFFSLFCTLTGLFSLKSFAQEADTCPAIYGGGLVCQEANDFRIDKKVQTPKDGSYVDRIPENETKVAPNRTMIFRIQITNKTDKTLRSIRVTDTLPNFVQFVRSDGTTKQNKQEVSYTIQTLEAKKTHTMNIQGKVLSKDKLPDSSPLCVANQAEAKSGFSQTALDFVTFCIDKNANGITTRTTPDTKPIQPTQKTSLPVQNKGGQQPVAPTATTTQIPTETITKGGEKVFPAPETDTNPNTGPELLALIALLPAGGLGLYLRKKSL